MYIKYVTQIINGKVSVSDQDLSLPYFNDKDLEAIVIGLIMKGYAFSDEPAGWPPSVIVQDLKDKGLVNRSFTAIAWSGPNDYRTYEVT